jgi:hypothetical protein
MVARVGHTFQIMRLLVIYFDNGRAGRSARAGWMKNGGQWTERERERERET